MTSRNKKIYGWIAVAAVVALVLLYIFCPPVHRWGNALLGRDEKGLPKPDTTRVDEFEYGRPVEEVEIEKIDVPHDSLLDSLALADSLLTAGIVKPVVKKRSPVGTAQEPNSRQSLKQRQLNELIQKIRIIPAQNVIILLPVKFHG